MTYRIIHADPPWHFKTFSEKGQYRSASQHYDTMGLDDICSLPVQQWAETDSALFLWAIDPMLPAAMRLIEAWGFTYKTVAFTWVKTKGKQESLFYGEDSLHMGTGYWTRSNPEMCLLATRGKPSRIDTSVRQVVFSPRREHSRKPDVVPERIVQLMGDVPRLEMFARTQRPGWDAWGNETEKFEGVA